MSKFELSLAPNYVEDWTISDAIRELFQNAIDQETLSTDNKMFFNYDKKLGMISIGNKKSVLEPKSLLLGGSTKVDDDNTIGKFGEGYKIATLVLLRNDKKITFYNYGAKEVWKPRFVNSRRYGSKILTFDVSKNYFWETVPDNNLTIVVEGITESEYEDIKNVNLYLQDKELLTGDNIIPSDQGNILMSPEHTSKIFVNGLYVSTNHNFKYGYSIKPKYLKLDRDRKLIQDIDLYKITREMWRQSEKYEIINDMLKHNKADVEGMEFTSLSNAFKDNVHTKFKEEHGENAVPVSYTFEINELQKGYKPIIVSQTHKNIIVESKEYVKPNKKLEPLELLEDWINKHKETLNSSLGEDEVVKLIEIFESL